MLRGSGITPDRVMAKILHGLDACQEETPSRGTIRLKNSQSCTYRLNKTYLYLCSFILSTFFVQGPYYFVTLPASANSCSTRASHKPPQSSENGFIREVFFWKFSIGPWKFSPIYRDNDCYQCSFSNRIQKVAWKRHATVA